MRKRLIVGAAAAALLGVASAANASIVVINSSSLASTAYTVHIGGTVDGNAVPYPDVYEAPEVMNISVDGGPAQDVLAFCVDLFHLWTETTPVTYFTSPVSHNSDSPTSGGGTALSNEVSGEIGYLASLAAAASDASHLAAIQGAIWQIEYPNITLSGGSPFVSTYTTLASTWAAAHPGFSGQAVGIYPLNAATGGFGITQGFTTTGVPEPATWMLTIGGFGLLGAALRRRREGMVA